MTTNGDTFSQDKTFDGTFRFIAVGGKISVDVKGSEQAFADHLRACGEQWIEEHTNGRVVAIGEVTCAYHYGWGRPAQSPPRRGRPRTAV